MPTPQVLSSNICAHIKVCKNIEALSLFSLEAAKICKLIGLIILTFSLWTFVFHKFCFVQCLMFMKLKWLSQGKMNLTLNFVHIKRKGTYLFLHYACEHHFEKKASVVFGVYLHDGWPNYNLQTHHYILTTLKDLN